MIGDFIRDYQNRINFGLINAFMMEHDGWVERTALKKHIDAFDDVIAHRETYYFRQLGTGLEEVARLSPRSMRGILNAVFYCNPHGILIAESIISSRFQRVIAALHPPPIKPSG